MADLMGRYSDLSENDKTMVAISQAIAGYYTYMNRRHMRRHLYEASFYIPIIEVLKARKWEVTQEYKINQSKNALNGKEIDFLARTNGSTFGFELKYAKYHATKSDGNNTCKEQKYSTDLLNGIRKLNYIN